jgi:high-affinity iron transporter
MLLAAVVLFFVSYWLVSKAEADRWQRYIRSKVETALSARSGTALGAAAFLAVYREGFETILFYQALFTSAPAGDTMVSAGLLAGTVLLGVAYVAFQRIQSRVPMRAFFLGTGAFLYVMAIVFAGRGVAELQEAGTVSFTPVAWMPRVETLGIFPTVESLAAQGVFVGLLVFALVVTFARRPAAPAIEAPAEKPSVAREASHG